MKESFKNYFKYSFDFLGVASRKEFWPVFGAVLGLEGLTWGLAFIGTAFQLVAILVFLGLLIPTLSLMVRRLHDTDRGAIYMLWLAFPIVGFIILLLFMTEKTKYFVS